MIIDTKCKKCRRAGEKLFLKAEKCFTPKCVFEKKSFPPGMPLSARKHRSVQSEYGTQLKEKQKVRNTYRLSEKQFSGYAKKASSVRGASPTQQLFDYLETRLDSTVYRLGFVTSRALARQIVSHGHITVNGKRLNIPSYTVKNGDVIGIREQSRKSPLFEPLTEKLQKHTTPAWLKFDAKKLEGVVDGKPALDKADNTYNFTAIMEFYSR